jgi:hypothetical protein
LTHAFARARAQDKLDKGAAKEAAQAAKDASGKNTLNVTNEQIADLKRNGHQSISKEAAFTCPSCKGKTVTMIGRNQDYTKINDEKEAAYKLRTDALPANPDNKQHRRLVAERHCGPIYQCHVNLINCMLQDHAPLSNCHICLDKRPAAVSSNARANHMICPCPLCIGSCDDDTMRTQPQLVRALQEVRACALLPALLSALLAKLCTHLMLALLLVLLLLLTRTRPAATAATGREEARDRRAPGHAAHADVRRAFDQSPR